MTIRFSLSAWRFLLRAGLTPDDDSPAPAPRFSPHVTLSRTARTPPRAPLEPPPAVLRAAGQAVVGTWPDEVKAP